MKSGGVLPQLLSVLCRPWPCHDLSIGTGNKINIIVINIIVSKIIFIVINIIAIVIKITAIVIAKMSSAGFWLIEFFLTFSWNLHHLHFCKWFQVWDCDSSGCADPEELGCSLLWSLIDISISIYIYTWNTTHLHIIPQTNTLWSGILWGFSIGFPIDGVHKVLSQLHWRIYTWHNVFHRNFTVRIIKVKYSMAS